jgi:RimJ/RimL family protein N-acetyltransferase
VADIAPRSTIDVHLREVQRSDIDVFFHRQQEPEANRCANTDPQSRTDFVAHWQGRIVGDDTVLAKTACTEGKVIGYVVAWWKDGRRCVGYWFGRSFWGRGLGTQALGKFLASETTRPLFADTDIGNVPSQRLLQRWRLPPRRNALHFDGPVRDIRA